MNEAAMMNKPYIRKIPYYLLMLFFVFEYGRIHSLLGPIRFLHLPFFTSLALLMLLLIEKPVVNSLQTKCLLALILLMGIHVPIAVNNHWAFEMTRVMFTYLVVHLAITKYVVSYDIFRRLVSVWLICGAFLCIQGLFQGGEIKGSAFFSDENDFSLAMNIFLGISYFRFLQGPRKNKIMLVLLGLFLLGILISFSRGGFVGLCVVLLFIWITSPKKILGLFLVVLLALFIIVAAPPKYWDEMKTITVIEEGRGTAAGRIYYWERAWDMFLDHPVLGVGPGNYPWNIEKYEPIGGYRERYHGGRAAHSMYFTLIAELGLAGCLVFGIILFADFKTLRGIMKNFRRGKRSQLVQDGKEQNEASKIEDLEKAQARNMMYYDSAGIYVALCGFLASGMFLSVLYYPHFWILTSLITSAERIRKELESRGAVSDKEEVGVPKENGFGLRE